MGCFCGKKPVRGGTRSIRGGSRIAWLLTAVGVSILYGCDRQATVTVDLDARVDESVLQEAPSARDKVDVFLFGFDQRSSPQEDARQYLPFLDYLQRTTRYEFELRFTPKDGQIVDDLGRGVIHFAAIGAESYIRAHEKYGVVPLVRGLNIQGKAEYQSVIVVALQSGIRKVSQLRGKRFAFGSVTSTQGHLIPRIVLNEHQLKLQDLAFYKYTGSHRNCANEVVSGRMDACGMQDVMGEQLARQGLVRVLYRSDYFPSSGIAASPAVPVEVRQKVTQAMLDFDPKGRHADGLYNWRQTEMPNGFSKAGDSDYDRLRHWSVKLRLYSDNQVQSDR